MKLLFLEGIMSNLTNDEEEIKKYKQAIEKRCNELKQIEDEKQK